MPKEIDLQKCQLQLPVGRQLGILTESRAELRLLGRKAVALPLQHEERKKDGLRKAVVTTADTSNHSSDTLCY